MVEITGNFDLYYLIVELIAGNLLTAMLFVTLMIFIIGVITKMSMMTIGYIEILFVASYMTLWFGGLWAAGAFMFSLGYAIWAVMRFQKESQS